jgi:hypothetical protein
VKSLLFKDIDPSLKRLGLAWDNTFYVRIYSHHDWPQQVLWQTNNSDIVYSTSYSEMKKTDNTADTGVWTRCLEIFDFNIKPDYVTSHDHECCIPKGKLVNKNNDFINVYKCDKNPDLLIKDIKNKAPTLAISPIYKHVVLNGSSKYKSGPDLIKLIDFLEPNYFTQEKKPIIELNSKDFYKNQFKRIIKIK